MRADPGGYFLCMSFFDITELADIDPPSSVWISSSSEPHDEEQQFELRRLQNWLERFHFTPLGLTDAQSPYHASGHISGPELLEMIRRIAPGSVIPVHTSSLDTFAHALAGQVPVLLPEPPRPSEHPLAVNKPHQHFSCKSRFRSR